MSKIIILIAILFIVAMWVAGTYNGLIQKRTAVEEGFSTMDVYLQKRADLIPNLVSTVKGYAKHEAETLEKVIAMRNNAYDKGSNAELFEAENKISGAIRGIFAVAEQYPDLKANENFLNLQDELTHVEEDIANARKYYNGAVKIYNNGVLMFPASIIANMFHFERREFFEASEENRQNVKVEF